MVHIWRVLGSISGPHCWVNKWSPSFHSMKTVVPRIVMNQAFRKGSRVFVAVWQQLPSLCLCSGGCWWMSLLDYKEGGGKRKPIKQGFFATPFLREGKGRKEERGQRSNKQHHFYTVFWGP